MTIMLNRIKQFPYAFLLAAQLISVIFYGFFDAPIQNQLFANLLGLVVPVIAVFVVYRTPAMNWVALGLLCASFVLILIATQFNPTWLCWAQAFESALYFYAAGSLVMYMYQDNVVSIDELFAAAATFTLLVWGFALAYSVCQQVYPHSILAATNPDAPRTWIELLFMSFSIQSSTGVGDVIPVSGPARAISALQIFAGAMYITVVVSRLVGLAASQTSTNK
jgi:Ion channel